jgi:SAM-dependent methyltransferase
MMDAYTGFALCYDALMSEVDYEAWTERLLKEAVRHGPQPRTIADLACGTGGIANALAGRGYEVVGIDLSQPMLSIAQDKAHEAHLKVRYLLQDIASFQLHRPVDMITMINDGINYLTTREALKGVFESMAAALPPGGLALLEFSTPYKLEHVLGNRTIAESDEDISMIWENHFDAKTRLLTMQLTFFLRDETAPKLYERFTETHQQRAHPLSEINEAAHHYFEHVSTLDSETMGDLEPTSERVLMIYRRRFQ